MSSVFYGIIKQNTGRSLIAHRVLWRKEKDFIIMVFQSDYAWLGRRDSTSERKSKLDLRLRPLRAVGRECPLDITVRIPACSSEIKKTRIYPDLFYLAEREGLDNI